MSTPSSPDKTARLLVPTDGSRSLTEFTYRTYCPICSESYDSGEVVMAIRAGSVFRFRAVRRAITRCPRCHAAIQGLSKAQLRSLRKLERLASKLDVEQLPVARQIVDAQAREGAGADISILPDDNGHLAAVRDWILDPDNQTILALALSILDFVISTTLGILQLTAPDNSVTPDMIRQLIEGVTAAATQACIDQASPSIHIGTPSL